MIGRGSDILSLSHATLLGGREATRRDPVCLELRRKGKERKLSQRRKNLTILPFYCVRPSFAKSGEKATRLVISDYSHIPIVISCSFFKLLIGVSCRSLGKICFRLVKFCLATTQSKYYNEPNLGCQWHRSNGPHHVAICQHTQHANTSRRSLFRRPRRRALLLPAPSSAD
jgi:hypothetical protein